MGKDKPVVSSGQCPAVLETDENENETFTDECAGDDECVGTLKCCSTGSGKQCVISIGE